MGSSYEGGCLCGAVRYRVDGEPSIVTYCHCRMCQRGAGSPVVAWAVWPRRAFAVTRGALTERRSSDRATRSHCAACGTPIAFALTTGDDVDVTVCSLDDPDRFPPVNHIWTSSRRAWFDTADALPRHAEEREPRPSPREGGGA